MKTTDTRPLMSALFSAAQRLSLPLTIVCLPMLLLACSSTLSRSDNGSGYDAAITGDLPAQIRSASDKEDALKLARSLRDSGYYEAATQVYAKAELDDRLTAAEFLEYATVAAEARAPGAVLPLYKTAVARLGGMDAMTAGQRYAACQGMGRATLAQGKTQAAIQYFRCALQEQPASAAALNGLAVASGLQGDSDTATALFQRILAMEPDNAVAANNLALQYLSDNKVQQAISLLQAEASPSATQTLNLALALIFDQQPDAARSVLHRYFLPAQADTVFAELQQAYHQVLAGEDLRQLLLTLSRRVYQLTRSAG